MSKRRDETIIKAVEAVERAGFAETAGGYVFATFTPTTLLNAGADDVAEQVAELVPDRVSERAAILRRDDATGLVRVVAFGTADVLARWDRITAGADA